MATGTKFQQFSEDLASGVHDLGTDTLNWYLSNTAPDAAADAVKADLAEITQENGYTAPVDSQNALSRTGGVTSITAVDATVTASGGTVGPFRYVVYYNDTPTSPADPLICTWDYGSSITLADGESFDLDVGTEILTVT